MLPCFTHVPSQHPSSCLRTRRKCFSSPRQLKRKATGLWSGNCLLSIRGAWLAFSSPGLHIYQGKLKETQEGVLLSNNHARLLDLSAREWNQSVLATASETHVKLPGFAPHLHVVVEAGILFFFFTPMMYLCFYCHSFPFVTPSAKNKIKNKMNVNSSWHFTIILCGVRL